MENQTLKMLEAASAFNLADCVEYKEGQIVSKNLVAKSKFSYNYYVILER